MVVVVVVVVAVVGLVAGLVGVVTESGSAGLGCLVLRIDLIVDDGGGNGVWGVVGVGFGVVVACFLVRGLLREKFHGVMGLS